MSDQSCNVYVIVKIGSLNVVYAFVLQICVLILVMSIIIIIIIINNNNWWWWSWWWWGRWCGIEAY